MPGNNSEVLTLDNHSVKVKRLFDSPEQYFKKDFDIQIRALIVKEMLSDFRFKHILDIGCGDGRISLPLLSHAEHLTLLDLSTTMLDLAIKNTPLSESTNVNYLNLDFYLLDPFQKHDLVLCVGLLAHLVSITAAIEKIDQLLLPGGYCIMQITDSDQPWGRLLFVIGKLSGYVNRTEYSIHQTHSKQLSTITAKLGWKMIAIRRYSCLLPGMGRLPNSWLYRYTLHTLRTPILSRFGSEAILLFQKDA
jgi:2-polyprenyl-3-methyl-5-hydroxy-6-metoxy-1,4-benzoquinol methylase